LTVRLSVLVKPGSKSPSVSVDGGRVVVRVREPAREGKANEACRKALAAALKIAPSRITLVRGATSKEKVFDIEDLSAEELSLRI
jgi:uncharacterized protein (TIGR00251 family)